jgi:hypothetical protein
MKHFFMTALLAAGLALSASTAWAQRGGGGHGGGHAGGGHAMRSGASRAFGGGGGRATAGASRSGPSVGNAVPRGGVLPGRGHRPIQGSGGYGVYGPAFGLGLGLGYYDPFWSDWEYAYGPGYVYPGDGDAAPYVVPPDALTGGLRIEVKPDTAEVYVDGYDAGIVDDFDGHFQHVDLTPGRHHIEVRAPGYATLTFDTIIRADQTTHFKGRMAPMNGSVR